MLRMERITNQRSRSFQMGFRRSLRLSAQVSWYFRKGQRATMCHTLHQHGLLRGAR